jgi:hypothetical protein
MKTTLMHLKSYKQEEKSLLATLMRMSYLQNFNVSSQLAKQ